MDRGYIDFKRLQAFTRELAFFVTRMRRVLVLRTVSNHDRQPRNLIAAQSLAAQRTGTFGAFVPALESAYSVGHVVANELLSHWTKYEQTTPAAAERQINP